MWGRLPRQRDMTSFSKIILTGFFALMLSHTVTGANDGTNGVAGLRAAISDLTTTFGARYAGGRSPLDNDQLNRLKDLTGLDWAAQQNHASSTGPWVSFDRPELSPCLSKLDKGSAAYTEALGIIQSGKTALALHPRGDTLDFKFCEKDRQREVFYNERARIEQASRKAILENRKQYGQE